jgi:hypothetical protein
MPQIKVPLMGMSRETQDREGLFPIKKAAVFDSGFLI